MANCWLNLSCKPCFISWFYVLNLYTHHPSSCRCVGCFLLSESLTDVARRDAFVCRLPATRMILGIVLDLQTELFTEIDTFHLFIRQNLSRCAVGDEFALTDDISAFTHIERFTHIVVGDQHAKAAVAQMLNDLLDINN